MITRRTTRRHFLLRPDRDGTAQQLYWYTTAVLAKKFGIKIHAVQVLSTHMHEVVTDTRGMLPAFLRERNRAFANALKCHRGWPEEVFQRAAANCVQLFGVDAVVRQICYTLANCVEAGLVNSPEDWPGAGVAAGDIGKRVVKTQRPNIYFDPSNPVWPAAAELPIEMPGSMLEVFGLQNARDRICAAAAKAVAKARYTARMAGRIVTSIADILRVAFFKRARAREPFGSRVPTFAAAGNAECAQAALEQRREFLLGYRQARDALKRGDPCARFPEGTWRWRMELLPPLAFQLA